jgi:hypothetical protein
LAFATITIMFVPVFFVIIERLREGRAGRGNDETVALDTPPDTTVS